MGFLNPRGCSPAQPVETSGYDNTTHFKFFSLYCIVLKYSTVSGVCVCVCVCVCGCLIFLITMFEAALIIHVSGNRSNLGRQHVAFDVTFKHRFSPTCFIYIYLLSLVINSNCCPVVELGCLLCRRRA